MKAATTDVLPCCCRVLLVRGIHRARRRGLAAVLMLVLLIIMVVVGVVQLSPLVTATPSPSLSSIWQYRVFPVLPSICMLKTTGR